MKYEQLENRGFRLTDEASGDKMEFHLRDKFTLWQLKQMGLFYSELTKSCTRAGSTAISMLLGIVGVTTSKSFDTAADAINLLTKDTLGDVGILGSGELIEFLCKDTNLERLAAILFLKQNEGFPGDKSGKRFEQKDMDDRIILFENQLELSFIIGAAKDFFGKKLESFGITASRLKIFVKQRIELATQISEPSTQTSVNGIDT